MTTSNTYEFKKYKKFLTLDAFFEMQAFSNTILVLLYLNHLNISFSQYIVIDLILSIISFAFEIPSGYISDKFGRKRVLTISKFFNLTAYFILLFFPNYTGGIIAIIFIGIGNALGSGNVSTILFESFSNKNKVDELMKLYGDISSKRLIFPMFYSLLAGLVIKYMGFGMIIKLDILVIIINIIFTVLLLDESHSEPKKKREKDSKTNIFTDVAPELTNSFTIFMLLALIMAYFRVSFNFYTPLLAKEFDVSNVPFIMSCLTLVSAVVSKIYEKFLVNKFKKINFGLIFLFISMLFFIVIPNTTNSIVYFILFSQVIRGIFMNLPSIYANVYISKKTKLRTTLISIFNFAITGVTALSLFFINRIDSISQERSLTYFTVVITLCFLLFYLIHKKLEKSKKVVCYI